MSGQPHYKRAKEKLKMDDREKQEGTHGHTGQSCKYPGPADRTVQKAPVGGHSAPVIIAMVCGVESVEGINFFGITRLQWLKQYLILPHGIPSADTILRVLARIGHTKFEECFANWTHGYFKERARPGPVIAIDGKTVRGSASETGKAAHLASAWAGALGLALGHVKAAGKSNEITAIPELLAALDVTGRIITIDAMGCQKRIAKDIIRGKGDYALPLKENRPETYAEVAALSPGNELGEAEYAGVTKDRGRIEKREAWLWNGISWFAGLKGQGNRIIN
jgi:hypothetical protein